MKTTELVYTGRTHSCILSFVQNLQVFSSQYFNIQCSTSSDCHRATEYSYFTNLSLHPPRPRSCQTDPQDHHHHRCQTRPCLFYLQERQKKFFLECFCNFEMRRLVQTLLSLRQRISDVDCRDTDVGQASSQASLFPPETEPRVDYRRRHHCTNTHDSLLLAISDI